MSGDGAESVAVWLPRAGKWRTGFSLVEAVIATLIVGVAFVAVINTVGASRATQIKTAQQGHALLLAQDLMTEILSLPYEDENPGGLGVEGTENSSDRSTFDDIDDYHNWLGDPPAAADGVSIAGADGYLREVKVRWVDPASPDTTSGTETGVKRIRVIVKRGSAKLVALRALRTNAWKQPVNP